MTNEADVFDTLVSRVTVDDCGTRRYYNAAGELHREHGPAITQRDGSVFWCKNGMLHREDGPAVIQPHGRREWWSNDRLHRIGGPAVEYADGSGSWYLNGVRYTEELYHLRCKEPGLDT